MSWTAATRTRRDVRRVRWSRAGGARQGAPEHVSIKVPSGLQELRLLELRGRSAPRVLVRVRSRTPARVGARLPSGGAGLPLSQITIADPVHGRVGTARMPQYGTTSGLRPGASAGCRMRAPMVRASTSAVTFGDLVVAERDVHEHLVRAACPGYGSSVMCAA